VLEPLIAARAKEKERIRKTTLQIVAESPATTIDTRAEVARIAGISPDIERLPMGDGLTAICWPVAVDS